MVSRTIAELTETIAKEMKQIKNASGNNELIKAMNKIKDEIIKTEERFRTVEAIVDTVVREILDHHHVIFENISNAMGLLQFQDVVRQRLEKVCDELKELSDYNEALLKAICEGNEGALKVDIKDIIDRFKKGYVMQSQ